MVAPDEGHGFARPVNNMAMFASAEKFLAKYLGGRYQESMTPEVSQRLKEINVDVKTVTLPKMMTFNIRGSETCGRSAAGHSQLQGVNCSRRTSNSAHA